MTVEPFGSRGRKSRRATIRDAFAQTKDMAEAAKILGVDVPQLRKWLSQDFELTRELRQNGVDLEPKRDRRQKYVPKLGISTKKGVTDNTPLASRRLTLREMRDAGIWVPIKKETSS